MSYKVWVQIEAGNSDSDTFEDVCEPIDIKEFDTLREAAAFVEELTGEAPVLWEEE